MDIRKWQALALQPSKLMEEINGVPAPAPTPEQNIKTMMETAQSPTQKSVPDWLKYLMGMK